jgi:hypothetical protein
MAEEPSVSVEIAASNRSLTAVPVGNLGVFKCVNRKCAVPCTRLLRTRWRILIPAINTVRLEDDSRRWCAPSS